MQVIGRPGGRGGRPAREAAAKPCRPAARGPGVRRAMGSPALLTWLRGSARPMPSERWRRGASWTAGRGRQPPGAFRQQHQPTGQRADAQTARPARSSSPVTSPASSGTGRGPLGAPRRCRPWRSPRPAGPAWPDVQLHFMPRVFGPPPTTHPRQFDGLADRLGGVSQRLAVQAQGPPGKAGRKAKAKNRPSGAGPPGGRRPWSTACAWWTAFSRPRPCPPSSLDVGRRSRRRKPQMSGWPISATTSASPGTRPWSSCPHGLRPGGCRGP